MLRSTLLALVASLLLAASLVSARSFFVRRDQHVGALNHRLKQQGLLGVEIEDVPQQWFTQKLDHQDFTSNATFQQLYYVNDTYYNAQNPIVFLIIGGEGPISPAYVSGHFQTGILAAQYGASQIAIEHRFYGQSVPNNDSSTANLKYLSSDQALEDLVTFHEFISQSKPGAKWIVFGGSYSGSLSAWARLKYPNLFLGSFAASAPVQAELDFSQYFEVVSKSVGAQCSSQLRAAQGEVNQKLATADGIAQLIGDFNLCRSPLTPQDVANFQSAITNPVAETVQYNDDAGRVQYDIGTICGLMEQAADPYAGLVAVWQSYNNKTGVTTCTDIEYTNMIESLQTTSDARSWTWQTCIEFGYFQTGEASDQPFSPDISLEFYTQQCVDIFGIAGLTPNINWINSFYGGNQIVTSNTIFTQGTIDPWHYLGTYQNFTAGSGSTVILIDGTAHCADMYSPQPTDLPGLIQARATQDAILGLWLNQAAQPVKAPKKKKNAKIILVE